MGKLIIEGGNRLNGKVRIQSSKNSILPLLAASILSNKQVILNNCPNITDVNNMINILISLGAKVIVDNNRIMIDSAGANKYEISKEQASELRSSVFMLGSVLSRFSRARIAYPGGCDIGLRPIGLHINGLKRMGVEFSERGGYINSSCKKLKGADIILDIASVGATENLMLAAVKADGITTIDNSAKEPEIVDLQNFLNTMGAKVRGAGTGRIEIEGVNSLEGCEYTPISDRIEAGTFLIAVAMCGGLVELDNVDPNSNQLLLHILRENGCNLTIKNDRIIIQSEHRLNSTEIIETAPYPCFPTDLQAPMCALSAISKGTTLIVENLFETRYKHIPELQKMGADITVKGKVALIKGVEKLYGANLFASDLRAGAALCLAGLAAHGVSVVNNVKHIYRGYSDFVDKFNNLGGKIRSSID